MRVAIQKLDGVASVEVSLERANTALELRAGNRVTLAQLRQIIKDKGFVSKEATVRLVGTLVERDGQPAVAVTGTDVVMIIAPDSKAPAAFSQAQAAVRAKHAAPVELSGVVETRAGGLDRILIATYAPAK